MKKIIITIASFFIVALINAQTYTILSNNNDTIRMYSNSAGEALKSLVPGRNSEGVEENYRLIEKLESGKRSLLFVEFTKKIDKIFVTYETNLVQEGAWKIKTYAFSDIFKAVKRENAILLKGELLGMKIELHQRPITFKDVINIDGIEFFSPIKFYELVEKMEADAQALLEQQKKDAEAQAKAKAESLEKNDERFGLTDEDIVNAMPNECYVAYLIVSQLFDYQKGASIMNTLCDKDKVTEYTKKYNDKQLKYLSKGYNKQLDKCKKW